MSNNQDAIREAQQDTIRETVKFAANLSNDSTLIILDYIINTSPNAPAKQIAKETGLSIRSINRHLKAIKRHPIASRIYTRKA